MVRRLAVRMSERMVLRIKARRDEEEVRGSRGKRDLRRLAGGQGWRGEGERGALDGGDHVFVAEDDEVVEQGLASVRGECAIVVAEKGGEMSGKVGGVLWIADGDLGDEGDEVAEAGRVVVWAEEEELSDAVVVVVLLHELFLVPRRIALDQILQLRQIRGEECSPSHRGQRAGWLSHNTCTLCTLRRRRRWGSAATRTTPAPTAGTSSWSPAC